MKEWVAPTIEKLDVTNTNNNGKGWGAGGVHNYNGQGNGQHCGVEDNNGLHNGWNNCIS